MSIRTENFDRDDVDRFAELLDSNQTQFSPAADFNADGFIDLTDLNALCERMLQLGADDDIIAALEQLKENQFAAVDDHFVTDEDSPIEATAPGLLENDSGQ